MPVSNEVFIHESAYVDPGCELGPGTRIWHYSHLMPGCKLGAGCNIGQNVFIAANVVLGHNVKVQNNVSLYEGVTCEDEVFLGPSAVFTNVINPRSGISRMHELRPTLVKRGASIGANATIICGIVIGRYALIGAGAVVTRDVPHYALVVGNPARKIGWVSENGARLQFGGGTEATCPESGQRYRLENETVHRI